jgi:hypothetical protein
VIGKLFFTTETQEAGRQGGTEKSQEFLPRINADFDEEIRNIVIRFSCS